MFFFLVLRSTLMETSDLVKKRILFVDDEENVLKALKRVFLDEPYEIITALSGNTALQILAEKNFAVIISDQRMPEMNGVEFLSRARKIQPDAVRIVLTGYADVQAAVGAINEGGASRYVSKPWNDADLVMSVHDAVASYELKQENARLGSIIQKQNEELKKWNSDLELIVQEQTIALQNKNKDLEQLNIQLKNNFKKSIEAFSNLIEMREHSVSNHSKNVAKYANEIAISMKLAQQEAHKILVAAMLHDIGKIGVHDSILAKNPEDLNEGEMSEYQKHAVRGQVAVDAIDGFGDIGILIRNHHENVDGSGYPDGLTRDSIPLGSRIIALVDTFDRLTNNSIPSPEAYTWALEHIEYYLDTRHDRTVFQHFAPIVKKRIIEMDRQQYSKDEELEIHPDGLDLGQILARDLRSGSGLLILSQGSVLDSKLIHAIQRYHRMDPLRTGVFVRAARGGKKPLAS